MAEAGHEVKLNDEEETKKMEKKDEAKE